MSVCLSSKFSQITGLVVVLMTFLTSNGELGLISLCEGVAIFLTVAAEKK